MQTVRVGFVGGGEHARMSLLPSLRHAFGGAPTGLPSLVSSHVGASLPPLQGRLVALAEHKRDHAERIAAFHGIEEIYTNHREMLENAELDCAIVCLHPRLQVDAAIDCLDAGLHVFVEKPLCLFEEELNDIVIQLRRLPNLRLSSNLILRKTPRFIELRERLQNEAMGVPYYWEGDYDYGRLHKITEGWRGQIPYYSVVHGGAVHLLDLIWWLSGKQVSSLSAFGNRITTKKSEFKTVVKNLL